MSWKTDYTHPSRKSIIPFLDFQYNKSLARISRATSVHIVESVIVDVPRNKPSIHRRRFAVKVHCVLIQKRDANGMADLTKPDSLEVRMSEQRRMVTTSRIHKKE